MLKAQNLVRRYGDFVAVNDVSFEIPKGSCFGLLGPNGAGKTSTIGMLVGLVKADAGTVTIDGKPVTPDTFDTKRRIGYVPQEIALYDDLTARANLQFIGGLYEMEAVELEKRIGYCLELSGLKDRADEKVKLFSGGMKRRLNIAIGLIHKPDLLVLDEPTVGVDPQSRNAIFDALRGLQQEGVTLLYTTHYMEEVERLCDHAAIMDASKIIAMDKVEELYKLLPGSTHVELTIEASGCDPIAAFARHDMKLERTETGSYAVETGNLSATLAKAAKAADAEEFVLTGVQTKRATLEEVFLYLTGKSLRD